MTATTPVGTSAAPTGSRRLWSQVRGHAPTSLADHRTQLAPPPRAGRPRPDLVQVVEAAGLRGRGGAGFPTAVKLGAVARNRGRAIVVVNGTEGEPTSRKDATLLHLQPHLVLDGAAVAAAAVGADQIHVCIDRGHSGALESVRRAVDERRLAEPDLVDVTVHGTPPRYIAGEETALVHWLNGGDAKPTLTPPRPFERGVGGRPTLVDNVETLAHLAQITQWGPEWFRGVGTSAEPGTALVTVTGAVDEVAVHEIALGSRLSDLLDQAGRSAGTGAILIGGYFGTWHAPAELGDVELSDQALRARGGGLGCGAVTVLPRRSCGVVEAARVLHWMAGESAGQCGMCVHGLAAVAQTFAAVARGAGQPDDLARLHRWAAQIEGRGACRMPDGVIRFLRSTVRVFGDDLARHAAGIPCEASFHPPTLPTPVRGNAFR